MHNKPSDVHRHNQNVKTFKGRLKLQSSQNKLAAPQYRKGDSHRQMMNVSHSKMGC